MALDRCARQSQFDILKIGIEDAHLAGNVKLHGRGFLQPIFNRCAGLPKRPMPSPQSCCETGRPK